MLRRVVLYLSVLSLFLLSSNAFADSYSWNQSGGGDYTVAANWTPARTTPAADDELSFGFTGTYTVTNVPTQTIGTLVVQNNTHVTFQASGTRTLTVAGLASTTQDLFVCGGGNPCELNVSGANALTIALGAGATSVISGGMTFSGAAHRLTPPGASSITVFGDITTGTGFSGNLFGTTALNAVTFRNGSSYVSIAGSNPFGAAQPNSVVIFETGSLYLHQNTGTPSLSGRTYANFQMDVATTLTATGGAAVAMNNLTVSQGTLNFNMTGTPGHTINGSISVVSGATLNFNPATAGTVNIKSSISNAGTLGFSPTVSGNAILNGTTIQNITNTGTLSVGANATITVDNAAGARILSSINVNGGTLALTNGTIITNANTLTIGSAASVTRTNGYVLGILRKDFAANGSKVFEVGTANGYSPVTADVTAGSPGNLTVRTFQTAQPNMNAATSIQRYWTLGASAGLTANLTFAYLDGDVMGNEALYEVYRVSGGVPTAQPASVVTAATNTATLAGVSSFSDWTIGEYTPPPLPQLSIADVSQAETSAGTTTFTFGVTLSTAAGPGGVTFDLATADGTAQDGNPGSEDDDYVFQSLSGQILEGSTGPYNFNVTVNGDVVPEANETFFVNVTNVTGATVADGQGQGTIGNDDVACADLSITDVTQNETNAGTTNFAFTVSLSQAGCGAVTFDIGTSDGTAQDDDPVSEDNDYVPQSLTGQTITFPSTYTFNVVVSGDATQEPDQTFFVNITNVSPGNAVIADGQGLGTIVDDDFTRIHAIQGPGGSSPLSGSVTTRGIVTGRKANGFFLQSTDASADADPMTSEGVFVFTSSAPPAAAAVGNYVEVTGTITEFVPSADLLQPPLTELTSPTTVLISTGNPLPTPVPLVSTPTPFPDPSGAFDQLERLEGMRVSVASLTTSSGTLGNSVNEADATQASSGVFFGTVTGVARPAREPGIQAPDPAPSGGAIPPIPRFDANPELIRVDSDGLVGAPILDVDTGATVTGLVGPLDYGFRRYTILPDPTLPAPIAAGGLTATAATPATSKEVTVASYNVERFFDTIGDPVLTATAYDNRLNKLSLGIRNHLRFPDIIGLVEVENLGTLSDIATRVNNDAVANTQPNPQYVAYLQEGNDVGGIDVGFLVKTAIVTGATPRVTVNAVVQENAGELFVNADSSTELLNDRPPLRLDAVVTAANGATFPVTVIVVHQRSLVDVNNEGPGSAGWASVGARVRAKRQAQAASLANLVQTRQANNSTEKIILVGDFNAYEFNDGLADTMGTLHGTPSSDNETAVPGDGADLVNPNLDNLFDTLPAGERYSYVFDGQTQNIDHGIVNAALIAATTARRIEHPRINTDFRAVDRNDANTARHLSDHDPLVGYFEIASFASAELSITKSDSVDPVPAGQNFFYTITVNNDGPDLAENASWTDSLPAGTTFVSLSSPGGWSCTTPAVGANGTVTCSVSSLAVGSAAFTLTVAVDAAVASGTVLSNVATVDSTTDDPNGGNDSDTETTTVSTSADLQLTTTDSPDPVTAGNNLTYQITITNNGPSNAASASFSDTLPAGTTFVSLSTTGSWPCTTPVVGATGTVSCLNSSFGVTVDFFTLVVNVDASVATGTILSNTAAVSSSTADPNSGNESDTETTTVNKSADVSISKTLDTAGPYVSGQSVTYTILVANAGPSSATSVQVADTPSNLTITGVSGACATLPCSIPAIAPAANATLTVTATIDSSGAFDNSATATAAESDPNSANNSDTTGNGGTSVSADLSIDIQHATGYATAGSFTHFTFVVTNNGPSASDASWSYAIPAGWVFGSYASPAGWDCTAPPGDANGTVTCSTTSPMAVGSRTFDVGVKPDAATPANTAVNHTAAVTGPFDNVNTNDSDTANVSVLQPSQYRSTKTVSGTFVQGTNVTYTITIFNDKPFTQANISGAELTDVLPPSLELVSATASTGTANANVATNTVTWDGSIASGATATITIVATIGTSSTGTISNQASLVDDFDNNGSNERSTVSDDPAVGGTTDPTSLAVIALNALTATKSASGTFVTASTVTYTIVLTNNLGFALDDNSGDEFDDVLPAGLALDGASATSGAAVANTGTNTVTWNGSIANGASVTITITATITATSGTISNQGTAHVDTDDNGTNETNVPTDDPNAAGSGSTSFTANSIVNYPAAKSVSTSGVQGSPVTYTVVITNNMPHTQQDNPGDEFTDVLPAGVILVSATATGGTAVANTGTNTVTWNGAIPSGGSVTITINGTVASTATGPVSNQGTVSADLDNNGSNETNGPTDDPTTGTADDATTFTASAPAADVPAVPTLSPLMMLALAAMLGLAAFARIVRSM